MTFSITQWIEENHIVDYELKRIQPACCADMSYHIQEAQVEANKNGTGIQMMVEERQNVPLRFCPFCGLKVTVRVEPKEKKRTSKNNRFAINTEISPEMTRKYLHTQASMLEEAMKKLSVGRK